MRPPAPAARDTPTSRTGTPPAAGALPGEARPERSPTRGKAAPPFGAPDAQPGALPDAQPGTGPDAGADAKPSAPPPAPRKEAVRGQGHPRRNASPLWAFSRWIFPRQAPVRRGPIPRASVRRNASGASEGPARSPAPARRESPGLPIPDRAARARAPSPLPPLFLLLFLIGHTLRKGFPEGYGQGFGRSPGQDFRDGWRKRRARPGPTRRGTPRRTRCGTPPQASGRPHPCAPAWPLSAGIPASP